MSSKLDPEIEDKIFELNLKINALRSTVGMATVSESVCAEIQKSSMSFELEVFGLFEQDEQPEFLELYLNERKKFIIDFLRCNLPHIESKCFFPTLICNGDQDGQHQVEFLESILQRLATEHEVKIRECDQCGRYAPLLCSVCKTARYCGKKCQKLAWRKYHHSECFASRELTTSDCFMGAPD